MNLSAWPRHLALLLCTGLLLLNVACTPEPAPQLRIGINAWPGYEFLYLAQEKGFYRDEALNLHLVEFGSLSDTRRAYERGQIDAMATTVIEVMQARDHSTRSPQIVQVTDYSNGADVILARSGIARAADLRGARVGVELASLGFYVLTRALEKNALTLADIKLVSTDQLAMTESFIKGELDAVVTYPPFSTRLLHNGRANTVFSSAKIPGEVVDVIAVEADINAQRPGDVTKFLRAYQRAVAYARGHPAEAYRIMAEREGITPEEFAAALLSGIRLVPAAEQAAYLGPGGKLATVVNASDRVLRHNGQIKGPDRRDQVYTSAFATLESRP